MRKTLATFAAFLALLGLPLSAAAAYPPGTFPGPAPGGAYRTVVVSKIVCSDGASMLASYDQAALTLEIPKGAFSTCTQVSIYVAEPGVITPLLPAGADLVDGFAVGWTPSGPSSGLLRLTIDDAAITAGAQVLATTANGLHPFAGAKTGIGQVVLAFSESTGFVVAVAGGANQTPEGGVLGATSPPSAGSPDTATPANHPTAWILGTMLLGSLLLIFVALRRRRANRPV